MSDDRINVTFSCPSCGADPATLELPDDHTDDSIAHCKGCGVSFGRYGDIKSRAMETARDAAQKMLRDAFKGVKGWKIK